ncbi:MAG: tetratricopeptide repeat protein [Nitrospirae bacterium]|nr:tetratricopeptide repeat protein [Nitrospirota bacterium]
MRIIVLALIIVSLVSVSFCWANEAALKDAYSLYYKGKKEAAIKMMEDYVHEKPDPGVLYFLGYAYYEKKDMDKAREYFSEAFRLKDFYSPVPSKESQ